MKKRRIRARFRQLAGIRTMGRTVGIVMPGIMPVSTLREPLVWRGGRRHEHRKIELVPRRSEVRLQRGIHQRIGARVAVAVGIEETISSHIVGNPGGEASG